MAPQNVVPPKGLAILVGCLSMLGAFAIDTYLPALRAIAEQLHSSEVVVQQTMSAYLLAFALMTLWHGTLSDCIGRRPVVLWGLAIFAGASVGCALASSIEALIFFRILQGLSAGAGGIVGRAMIRDCLAGVAAQRALSYTSMIFGIAPAIAPVIGGMLLKSVGWPAIFWFIALFAALLWLVCWQTLSETHPASHRQPYLWRSLIKNYIHILGQAPFQLPALILGLNFGGAFLYVSAAPRFLIDYLGLSTQEFAWLFLPMISGMTLGSFCSNRLAGRFSWEGTIRLGFAVILVAVVANLAICAFLSPRVPWNVLPLGCYGFGMSLIAPAMVLRLFDTFLAYRGLISSLQSFVQMTIGALVAGLVAPIVSTSLLGLAFTLVGISSISYTLWLMYQRYPMVLRK